MLHDFAAISRTIIEFISILIIRPIEKSTAPPR